MELKVEYTEPTKFKLTVVGNEEVLKNAREQAVLSLANSVKVPGFRTGKAPVALVEKQLDPGLLQNQFLDDAINDLYPEAVKQLKLRPVSPPSISITKFVPFSTLEFTAEADAVGEIKLGDYKKIKLAFKTEPVKNSEVDNVIENLRQRAAVKNKVDRAAKNGDEVTIDFTGSDQKTGEPIEGAEGKDYPLIIGSKNFIPGFEDELIGLKTGGKKEFTLTFPSDYGVPELRDRAVKFEVEVKIVNSLTLPKLDNAFAATVGPFKTTDDLKADIKKGLKEDKDQRALRQYEEAVLEKIAESSDIAIPKSLVDEELTRLEEDEKRDLIYRGQTWQEHLESEGVSEEEHRERNRDLAENRVKAGLILGEIADQENLTVSTSELEEQVELLKARYPDPKMQEELNKAENKRDILGRLLTEKTLRFIADTARKSN